MTFSKIITAPKRVAPSYPLRPDGRGSLVMSFDGDRVFEDVLSLLDCEGGGRVMHPTYSANPEVFNAFTGQADVVAYMYLRFKFWLPEITTLFDWEFVNGVLNMTVEWSYVRDFLLAEDEANLNTRKYKFTIADDWQR
jgi:hypothetical protein